MGGGCLVLLPLLTGTYSAAPASRLTSPRFCSVTSCARQWVCSSPVVGYALLPAVGYTPVEYALLTVVFGKL